jgi:hypothetical protein
MNDVTKSLEEDLLLKESILTKENSTPVEEGVQFGGFRKYYQNQMKSSQASPELNK